MLGVPREPRPLGRASNRRWWSQMQRAIDATTADRHTQGDDARPHAKPNKTMTIHCAQSYGARLRVIVAGPLLPPLARFHMRAQKVNLAGHRRFEKVVRIPGGR